ncbi:AAA family ATPase [Epibacterium sp. DP7N7-1]|nr:AAA family ATPase [Epibacterium sp. DP7N7-1]
MIFYILERGASTPSTGKSAIYLTIDFWNDYSFVTQFYVDAFDEHGQYHELGHIKIGFVGQTASVPTHSQLPKQFSELSEAYFSLGQSVEFYQILGHDCTKEFRDQFLRSLNDIVFDSVNFERGSGNSVFKTSLLRDVSLAAITGQFKRVMDGGVPITNFHFLFERDQEEKFAGLRIPFTVTADSKPTTNIHALIGRNGVGKTTLLNDMINAIVSPENPTSRFLQQEFGIYDKISPGFFSSLVSISFSAFDPFSPPPDQSDPEKGPRYFYVGLKDIQDDSGTLLKSLTTLHEECIAGLQKCLDSPGPRRRWLNAITTLESDENFAEMNLTELKNLRGKELTDRASNLLRRISSGHAIVLLTITKLVEKVEEKTLILLDEPESHLHPPLLSAFTRALSELLTDRNGVAIIATHSPVVLQEVPKSCVWKVTRSRLQASISRPAFETFGENVGILTREVFGLEVVKSGYHTVLAASVAEGGSFDDIVAAFNNSLGFEAKAVLRAMIMSRDAGPTQQ